MNIALLGYGKMGHAVETLATQHGHSIVATIDNDRQWEQSMDRLRECDVAIDFSLPSVAVANIERCFGLHLPVVVGTTGWYDHLDAIVQRCRQEGQALFVASNFSIGMNIMFDLNRRLADLMGRYPDYSVAISETHHIHKLDAPSGTAITLATDIIARHPNMEKWQLTRCIREGDDATEAPTAALPADTIPVTSLRQGEVPGIHQVVYDNAIDTITISHSAKSRAGLAQGALLAAEYLKGKQGYFTMQDLINE